jgi:zinc transporter ZupT
MELYHWLALAGGVLALLALVLAVALRNRPAVRVPASVAAALAGFAAGVGVGVILLSYFGYHWEKKEQPATSPAEAPQDGPAAM